MSIEDNSMEYKMCFKKKRYQNEMACNAAIGVQQYRDSKKYLRAYKCPICSYWHISHKYFTPNEQQKFNLKCGIGTAMRY